MGSEEEKPQAPTGGADALTAPSDQTASVLRADPASGAVRGGPAPASDAASDATHSTGPAALGSSGPRTFAEGDVVAARYQILRFIAQGGMGEVYEAKDLDLEGRVALKTVRPEFAAQKTAFARFKREIQLARKVTHPNVCRIFDLGHHQSLSGGRELQVDFLTMELLEGETLGQRIKRLGRMPPGQALPIVQQMAAALATAHDAGIIHRDFKSSNVMLVPSKIGERAVVTDFGLARGVVEPGSDEGSLTGSGDMVGTPAYMAPEQIEGKELGPAADVYALGVVIFEMVTGAWPFTGETPIAIAVKHLKERPPSPRSLVKELDARWEAVILRCLERHPGERFSSATDVVKALAGEEVGIAPRARRRVLAAATAAVALALGVGYFLSRLAPISTPAPGSPAAPAAVKARRSVAVLGFKNLGRPEADWLSTAVSEMLRTELGAGEKLRTIPSENVARMKVELSLAEADSLAQETLARVRANLGADVVVLGSYLVAGKGGKVRLDLRLQDTSTGDILATASSVGTEEEVFDLVSDAGTQLRPKLGLGEVSEAEAGGVRAALPSNPQAARLYAEGLAKLRVFDALAARDRLQKAAALDPSHALAHSALATAWSALGYDEKAKAEAQRAFDLSEGLSRGERLSIEGLMRETAGEWDKAVEIYRGLLVFFPDSLEYGLRCAAAQTSAGKGEDALRTLDALRKLPPPASGDPRLDLAEAAAAKALTDFPRQRKAAAQAAAKAQAQGARLLVAQARLSECSAFVDIGQLDEARAACEEARRIFEEAGNGGGVARTENLVAVALAKSGDLAAAKTRFEGALRVFERIGDKRGVGLQLGNIGNILEDLEDRVEAKKLYEQSLRTYREIGDKSGVARQLNNLASASYNMNELEFARRTYEEAINAFAEIGETRNMALAMANLGEVLYKQGRADAAAQKYEESLRLSRQIGARNDAAGTLMLLGKLLIGRNDVDGAAKAFEEALSIYRAARQREEEAAVLRHLGDLQERRGDASMAKKLREQAAVIDKELAEKK